METPYDYFLINLKMIETMVNKMIEDGSSPDNSVHLQIALLKDVIKNLNILMKDLMDLKEQKN